ncbi:MAG: biotin/lipoyl-containing protein [Pirellulaceae bacterium]|nr:biotin/lipoyl-binding protein [Planctomycetales bacterium]
MKLKITVDGQIYEVDVEVDQPEARQPTYVPPVGGGGAAPRAASGPSGSAASPAGAGQERVADESKVCRSPISGVVVKVPVQAGQSIQVDDVLLVLEAMKMETVITAPVAGKIAEIRAQVGDSVKNGQVLVVFA